MGRNKLILTLIKKYQKHKAIIGTGHCKFYPTCSVYAYETFKKFNFFYAFFLTSIRLLKCHPLAKRKYDPVKLTKEEKLEQKYLQTIDLSFNEPLTSFLMALEKIDEISNLYPALKSYYDLENYALLSSLNSTPLVIGDLIITNDELQIKKTKRPYSFDSLLKIVDELKDYDYLKKPVSIVPLTKTENHCYNINDLTINDIIKLYHVEKGIILINNYLEDLRIDDFFVVRITKLKLKELTKLSKQHPRLIVQTTNIKIINYLAYCTLAINFYQDIKDINYLYHLNKRL